MNRLASKITCLLCCCLAAVALAGCAAGVSPTGQVRGTLHGTQSWQGEVLIASDVILAEDAALIIMPGTQVRFLPPPAGGGRSEHPNFAGNELIVKGTLKAVGTAQQPIVFAAADVNAAPGAWGSINIVGSRKVIFEYCIFRQADSAVHSRNALVNIEQSLFEDNLVGVRFHDTDLLLERSLLRRNRTAVRFHFGSPVISENRFEQNEVNLFITSRPRDLRIENNVFGAARDYQVVLGEEVPEDVSLPRNLWPVAPSQLSDLFFDGSRSAYLGRVLSAPERTEPPVNAGLSWSP
jgi:hypothetical protein